MTDEARQARNAYYRAYNAAHKDQRRKTAAKYWANKAESGKTKTDRNSQGNGGEQTN